MHIREIRGPKLNVLDPKIIARGYYLQCSGIRAHPRHPRLKNLRRKPYRRPAMCAMETTAPRANTSQSRRPAWLEKCSSRRPPRRFGADRVSPPHLPHAGLKPENRLWSRRSGAIYWAPSCSLTASMHYPVHLGDALTRICSSILRHLIPSKIGFRVKRGCRVRNPPGKQKSPQPLAGLRALKWWQDPESNRGHVDFQSTALPTELSCHFAGDAGVGAKSA